jgi:GNAT superfamily N-acetyltransferase
MLIRRATLSDAKAIANLASQLGYPMSRQEARERLLAILEKTNHAAYVAEAPREGVVGWVHVLGTHLLVVEPFAEIGGLVVDEAHRGTGIGKALLEKAETWARDQGHRVLRIRSNVVRTEAHAFYESMGYAHTKTSHVFAKSIEGQQG